MVQHVETQLWREQLLVECKCTMGFLEHYTIIPGVTERGCREMLGKVMDPNTMQFMFIAYRYMAPVVGMFLPSTSVLPTEPAHENLEGSRVANEADENLYAS